MHRSILPMLCCVMAVFGNQSSRTIFPQRVIVGVGDMAVANNPYVTLSTYALGSCVGVVGYDPETKAGGMLHIMLPRAAVAPDKAKKQPYVFADTGVDGFLRALESLGVGLDKVKFVLAGGANVIADQGAFRIGERNVEAVKKEFEKQGLPICAEYLGGLSNRTLHLNMGKGVLSVKMPDDLVEVELI